MDRRMTLRAQHQNVGEIMTSTNQFPPLTVKPPRLKTKAFQYPSGNGTGTENCAQFDAKLKELMMAQLKAAPKK
jgi:hypothetical protein